jgi:hypothetical protein
LGMCFSDPISEKDKNIAVVKDDTSSLGNHCIRC